MIVFIYFYIENFIIECWDYNIDNTEIKTDLLSSGSINLKNIKFDMSNNSSF